MYKEELNEDDIQRLIVELGKINRTPFDVLDDEKGSYVNEEDENGFRKVYISKLLGYEDTPEVEEEEEL
jgi:hypothetical protein